MRSADREAIMSAMEGIDTVHHMAANPISGWGQKLPIQT